MSIFTNKLFSFIKKYYDTVGIETVPYSSKPQNAQNLTLKCNNNGFSVKNSRKWYFLYNQS